MKKFLMGFVFAFRGIKKGFRERSMRFHGVATIGIILIGWFYKISTVEWIIILILISLIWMAELINSSLEKLNNTVRDELGLDYKATTDSRDLAAGSVLVIAIVAVIVGIVIFVPKIINCRY
jgi:diacylglycerol kinase